VIGRAIGRAVLGRRPRGAPAKTYADFVAHITELATSGTRPWGASTANWGSWKTTAAAATGTMYGSSWNSIVSGFLSSAPARIIQHGLPSQTVFNNQVANARDIYFKMSGGNAGNFPAVNRNGYQSLSAADDGAPDKCDEIIYWDGTQAWRMQPNLGLGPTPYTW
jgi:hypothetical protein